MTTSPSPERFESLIEAHKKILYKVCHSYCQNQDDRDDLAQEILIQLWRSYGNFDGRCRFSTWMYRIALNIAISFYRRERTRKRDVVIADEKLLDTIIDPKEPPEEIQILYAVIERLNPLNRALLLLYLDGYSHQEIGEVLGISESNVGTKISRLKKAMQQEWSEMGPV